MDRCRGRQPAILLLSTVFLSGLSSLSLHIDGGEFLLLKGVHLPDRTMNSNNIEEKVLAAVLVRGSAGAKAQGFGNDDVGLSTRRTS